MNLDRRTLLSGLALLPDALRGARELRADIAVIGAGVGGCAAALAALREGRTVILSEPTDWPGGQLTSQAVPPDEHYWIESYGCTRLYRSYRNAVREYYWRNYPVTEKARADAWFNPGTAWVSRVAHEPRVGVAVLQKMMEPHLKSGRLTLLLEHTAVQADAGGDRVRVVTLRSNGGVDRTISAQYFLDATEQGDLLPLTRTEYVTGFESRRDTGEPHAPAQAQPANLQSFTVCFALEWIPGRDHTISKPEEYGFWRDYVPALRPPWSGRLLSWTVSNPATLAPRKLTFDPAGSGGGSTANMWNYRRILDRGNFRPGAFASDISVVNWPQNDYLLGNLHEVSAAEAARHLRRAKQLGLSLLYWMQTEAPRADGGRGWKGLRLRPDVMGTSDGFAKQPYVRESRRIKAEFTVIEQHLSSIGGKGRFPDSVGVGSYRIDLHPSTGGDNYMDLDALQFQIPLGALLPRRMENLLPAAKNLGVTHLTNGAYRLHPVEWNIGEAAGMLASQAIALRTVPRRIRSTPRLLADFQKKLTAAGIELAWP